MPEKILHIEGSVENIVFSNEANGYVVLDLDSGGELITVVGNLGNVEEGEVLALKGGYVSHHKFGMQFKAEYCERKLPEDTVNIEKYLASGAIKGIGKILARKIVKTFGENTLEIIENSPEKLVQVKGITAKKCKEITLESQKLFALRKIMSYLSAYDINPKYVMNIYRRYGTDSMKLIKRNPYIMCGDGIELEFEKADAVAYSLKIEKNSVCRVIAGIQNILKTAALNGHSCLPVGILMKNALKILDISERDFLKAYNTAVDDNELFIYIKNNNEFVYLPDYYYAESFISDRIKAMNRLSSAEDYDYDTLIDIEEQENNIVYEDIQRKAVAAALSNNIMILTGGPGTGKTTTLNAIISIFEKKGDMVFLAAPTGRASKRMSDLTGYEAKTIHRLLEVVYDSDDRLVFAHDENNPLECDVIVIDEMSMVDCVLFEKLLRALRMDCKIIMVGDFHQLPSVGAGNLLEDIINSNIVTVVELTKIFRQAQKSCIITNAHRIVSGEYPDITRKNSDFFFFRRNNYENAVALITDLAKRRLPEAYSYSPFDDIQIITPSRKGTVGTAELNKVLQHYLNPPSAGKTECKVFSCVYRVGDKVMQIKNNYSIVWEKNDEKGEGIFNGDIGKILEIDTASQTAEIDFDGRIASYSFELLSQIELAYAITVHKSQGCEFEAVIMPVMDGFERLFYRNLLYTAVTRAKKLLILVGSEEKIYSMVDNNKRTMRYTCLKDMLQRKD